jgi:hypothetical protein
MHAVGAGEVCALNGCFLETVGGVESVVVSSLRRKYRMADPNMQRALLTLMYTSPSNVFSYMCKAPMALGKLNTFRPFFEIKLQKTLI